MGKKRIYNDNSLAICYYRYSSHSQNEASIQQQREAAERYAEAHGLIIVKEYEDAAISGKEEKRPGFQLMLSEMGKIKPSSLILWKTDRLSRDRYVLVIAKRQIRDAGIQIHLVAEAIPQDGPEAILLESLMEGMADFYSEQLRQNIMRGLRHNAEHGFYNGRKILGYKGKKGEPYEIDEKTAPIVRRIFRDYNSGIGLRQLADNLNADGLRTIRGDPFTINSLRWIIKNEAYVGVYRFGDIRIEGGMPKIIEMDDFKAAQLRMVENQRLGPHAPKPAQEDAPDTERYWLQGRLFCGLCGSSMQGVSGTSKTGARHKYYYCRGHREKRCSKRNVRKDLIEAAVIKYLDLLLNNTEHVARIAADAAAYYKKYYLSTGYLEGLQKQLQQTEKGIRNMIRAIEAGVLTESTQQRLQQLEQQRKDLQETIEIEMVKTKITQDEHSIQEYFRQYMHADLENPLTRDTLLSYFVDKIFVYDDRIEVLTHYTDDLITVDWSVYDDGDVEFDTSIEPGCSGSGSGSAGGSSCVRLTP